MKEEKNYTYMLRCADDSLYTGWTNDLERRIRCHRQKRGAKYTRSRLPVELAYYETFSTRGEAMHREAEIKKLGKAEKESLVREFEKRRAEHE